MKELKRFLMWLYIAIMTSSWWAASIWGYGHELGALWFIPAITTFLFILFYIIHIVTNWDEE